MQQVMPPVLCSPTLRMPSFDRKRSPSAGREGLNPTRIRLKVSLMKQKKKSPCVDVCDFSGPKGWCLGCGRTREECHDWKTMKPYARSVIEGELKTRLSRIGQEAAGPASSAEASPRIT